MSKLRNPKAWKTIDLLCKAVITLTFIAPVAYAIIAIITATNDDKYVMWVLPFFIGFVWVVIAPVLIYIWLALAYFFAPDEKSCGKHIDTLKLLSLIVAVMYLLYLPILILADFAYKAIVFILIIAIFYGLQIAIAVCKKQQKGKLKVTDAA